MNETRWCKVLVVEDEPPILNNVVRKVDGLALPVRVCGTAYDGEEACRLIEQEPPHIVITDIRMPGMDGLALSRYIMEKHPAIKVVVLSGYSEFEYAQAAIQYQVADYLLKPVNAQKLHDTLQKLCQEIGSRNRAMQRQYLAKQLSGGIQPEGLPCQFENEAFGLYLVCLGNLLDDYGPGDIERYQAAWNASGLEAFLDAQPFACWWLIEEKNPNERMVLTAGPCPGAAERIYQHLQATLAGFGKVNLCSAGRPVAFGEVWATAQTMRTALRRRLVPCENGCFALTAPPREEVVSTFHQPLMDIIHSRQLVSFRVTLRAALEELRAKHTGQQRLEEGTLAVLRAIAEQTPLGDWDTKQAHRACCRQIALATTSEELYERLENALCEAFGQLGGDNLSAEGLASLVKDYMEQNYRQEITMELLAKKFHFSESYIARLFRAQFGVPPVKYLLRLRVEKAKALIAQNKAMSFGAVAELVGYTDQHYFSRLFRLSTGMSPSEYKAAVEAECQPAH